MSETVVGNDIVFLNIIEHDAAKILCGEKIHHNCLGLEARFGTLTRRWRVHVRYSFFRTHNQKIKILIRTRVRHSFYNVYDTSLVFMTNKYICCVQG